jgi:hypothetical protein
MSKMRSTIAVCMVVLFATVALFPTVAGTESMKVGKLQSHSSQANSAAILMADGGEPQPPIPVPPAAMSAS